MFLSERSTQAESFDDRHQTAEELETSYRLLGRANRLFFFSHPFVWVLPRLLGPAGCRRLTILDVGAGDGSLGGRLTEWAGRRGWAWTVTGLDAQPWASRSHPARVPVVGSALNLPFADQSFDVVIASQMTHHLDRPSEVVRHFAEAWRVARRGVVISDLHRNLLLYLLVAVAVRVLGFPPAMRADGLASVRRAFRLGEWRAFAREAGLTTAQVWLYAGTRLILQARKPEFPGLP